MNTPNYLIRTHVCGTMFNQRFKRLLHYGLVKYILNLVKSWLPNTLEKEEIKEVDVIIYENRK